MGGFSQGALRKPSRELIEEIRQIEREIKKSTSNERKASITKIYLDEATRRKLEQMRRGF
nr:NYN domain-containing protein [Sporolactobacillus inulinus]